MVVHADIYSRKIICIYDFIYIYICIHAGIGYIQKGGYMWDRLIYVCKNVVSVPFRLYLLSQYSFAAPTVGMKKIFQKKTEKQRKFQLRIACMRIQIYFIFNFENIEILQLCRVLLCSIGWLLKQTNVKKKKHLNISYCKYIKTKS